jgi:hypothetical protein
MGVKCTHKNVKQLNNFGKWCGKLTSFFEYEIPYEKGS